MGRILVIEDEPGARMLLQSRLEDLGHEVTAAPTGAMGLMEARAGSFDLFLVDIVLGSGVDGYEVCRRLKGMPQTHRTPVVLVSAVMNSRDDLHRGYEAGCEAFLIKGDMTLLEDVVRAMLRIKSLQDDLGMQNRLLEEHNRSLGEERQRGADLEIALRESGGRASAFRELAAGQPDAVLIVDAEGLVRSADRGARELFGGELEGRHLGSLAPTSGLEAFVRDARQETREGFRFELPARSGRQGRPVSASVAPMVPSDEISEPGLRVLFLLDAGKRRVAAEMLRMQEQGVPRREMGPLLDAARSIYHPGAIIGSSPRMVALRTQVARVATSDRTVLLRGEPGAGKQFLARVLHFSGMRSGPFVPVNCGALSERILESELFGHVKGAFTGAFADRPGLLHQANLGTLFLDEISDLTPDLQQRLLKVLENGELCRVGASEREAVDVRVIAATTKDLEAEVEAGRFRRDLLFRINIVDLELPPLAARHEDIPSLATWFLGRLGAARERVTLSGEAMCALESYEWPGNVRELENCLERACALASEDVIQVGDLSQPLRECWHAVSQRDQIPQPSIGIDVYPGTPKGAQVASSPARVPAQAILASAGPGGAVDDVAPEGEGCEISLDAYERLCLLRALEETGGDRLAAARLLEVGKSTLYRKLKRHEIS